MLRVENIGDVIFLFLLMVVAVEGVGWLTVEVSWDVIILGLGQSMSDIEVFCIVLEDMSVDLIVLVDV